MTPLPDLVTGPWKLDDLRKGTLGSPQHGLTVFSCFHCGGGSTMGYKLAGFKVLGGVEIDKDMMQLYRKNHNPVYSYLMGVQEFKTIPDDSIPKELFDLDVLDGSPPCSSFSMAGVREDAWSEKKKFREGQADQVLDDLFFHFIEIAQKLKPKIVIAENVKGLIIGNAKGYVKEIFAQFRASGYETQLFLFNASRMGVPQSRDRTFFIGRRKDLNLPAFKIEFNEPTIPIKKAFEGTTGDGRDIKPGTQDHNIWLQAKPGDNYSKYHPKGYCYTHAKLHPDRPTPTLMATGQHMLKHWEKPRLLSDSEIIRIQSFPDDYDFLKQRVGYVCGMSVPPLMMQRVASEVAKALLK